MGFNNLALTNLGNIYEGSCTIVEEGSPVDPIPMPHAKSRRPDENKNTPIEFWMNLCHCKQL